MIGGGPTRARSSVPRPRKNLPAFFSRLILGGPGLMIGSIHRRGDVHSVPAGSRTIPCIGTQRAWLMAASVPIVGTGAMRVTVQRRWLSITTRIHLRGPPVRAGLPAEGMAEGNRDGGDHPSKREDG